MEKIIRPGILPINVITFNSDEKGHHCGYCDSPNGSHSFGLVIDSYPVEIYNKMMLDGWRRCGDYVYIPNLEKSCCKLYTHRLNIENFKINKDQKKVMKRFRKYLSGEYEKNLEDKKNGGEAQKNNQNFEKKEKKIDEKMEKIEKILNEYIKKESYFYIIEKYIKIEKKFFEEKMKQLHVRLNTNKKFKFDYSIDFIFVIRKIIESYSEKNKMQFNLYNQLELDLFNEFKLFYYNLSQNEFLELFEKTGHINITDKTKIIEEKNNNKKEIKEKNVINEINMEIKEKNQKNEKKDKKVKMEKEENIKQKYTYDYFPQIVNEPEIYLPLNHTYTLELTDQIQMNPEKFKIYKKYQMNIHKDKENKLDKNGYDRSWGKSNLVDNINIKLPSDLSSKTKHPEIYPKKYGCYNFIHRIDGNIVAVGIVDILPTCLSSVYLYYDTDFQFLDLGVLTAIFEIEYAKSFHDLIDNNFKYYTMGFFSETVQKLRYKGFYEPGEILDRFSMNYVYIKDVKDILKEKKNIRLSKEPDNKNYEYMNNNSIDNFTDNLNIVLVDGNSIIDYSFIAFCYTFISKNYCQIVINEFKRFLSLLPKDLIQKIKFYAKFR